MKVLWLSGNQSLYRRETMIDGGWIGALQKKIIKGKDMQLGIAFPYYKKESILKSNNVVYYPLFIPQWERKLYHFSHAKMDDFYILKLCKIVKDFNPDIIHCWGSELCFGLIAKYVNVPVVLHIQGIITPIFEAYLPANMSSFSVLKSLNYNPLKFYKKYYRPHKLMLYQANREKRILKNIKYYLGRTDWDRKVTSVLSPNSKYFYCSEALRPCFVLSKKWFYRKNNKLKLISTILSPLYKGGDVILRVAKILKTYYNVEFEWDIYGLSEMRIQEHFTGIKATTVNVKCLGKVDSEILAFALRNSDVFVHPSYIDNSPNSVCEAQYIGVPAIGTYVGGIPTLMKNGAGVLVPSNDVYQLAYYIFKIKNNKNFAISLSRNEIHEAEKRHNIDTIINSLLTIYKKIINERK